jgi:hypothetical protein
MYPDGLKSWPDLVLLVEASGLEPLTSCMPSGGSTSTRVHPCRSPSSRVPASPHTVLLLCYRSRVAVRKKRSISLPPDLDAEIAAAAEHAGMTYSSWLAATARKEFTIRAGLAAVAQFEDEHGAFTPGELADADQWVAEAAERASRSGTSTRPRSA